MKNLAFILLMFACSVGLFACKKDSTATSLTGKWNLVSDSLYSMPLPLTHPPVYITGAAGDYFDFRTDSKLYIKEGTRLDTLPYKITSGSTVQISTFGTLNNITPDSQVKLTANSATIITNPSSAFLTPAGNYYRVVHLSR